MRGLSRDVDRLTRAADPKGARGANRLGDAWEKTSTRMEGARGAALALRAGLAGAVVAGAVATVRSVAAAGLEFQRLERRMRFAAGSAQAGAAEMAFVRAEAERLGLDLVAAADGYSKFAAAAKGTALEGQAARDVFTAIAEASTVMGLTAEQTGGAMTALEQILSKGKVSAEELRGQLGERLPGAFQIAARAMGVSTRELDRMLAAGELISQDFLPKFAAELRRTLAGDVEAAAGSAQASFNRLGNAIRDLKIATAESGLIDFLSAASEGVTRLLRDLGGVPEALDTRIDAIKKSIAALVALEADRERAVAAGLLPDAPGAGNAARIQALREELALLEERFLLETAPAQLPGRTGTASAAPDPREVERATKKIEAITKQAEERLARAALDRIARIDRAEAKQIGDIRAKLKDRLVTEEQAEAAITAVQRAAAAERTKVREDEAEARARVAASAAEEHARIIEEIEGQEVRLDITDDYEAAIAAANRWRDETLAALDATAPGYDALKERIEAVHAAMVEAAEAAKASGDSIAAGFAKGFRELSSEIESAGELAEGAVKRHFLAGEDALAEFVTRGKADFKSLADSIIADLARIAIRQAITGPIARALGSLFGSGLGVPGGGSTVTPIGPGTGGLYHSGGIAGSGSGVRRTGLDPAIWANAPRYHSGGIVGGRIAGGLRPNEMPAILEKGEGVLTAAQTAALMGAGAAPMRTPMRLRSRS